MAPVDIIHLDVKEPLPSLAAKAEECLVVLWWADYPMGQVWDVGPVGRELDFSAIQIAAAPVDVLAKAKTIVDREQTGVGVEDISATVVICTRDRPNDLRRCLASLPQQTKSPTQVVVVDNGSRENMTRKVALAAGVDYVREDRPGLDIARNVGARRAAGEIVAYTDDDVRLHPRWLERLVRAFDGPHIAAATGLVLPAELVTAAQRHFEIYWSFGRGYRSVDFGPVFFAADRASGCRAWEIGAGASMAFRRGIFAKLGYFDERLDVGAAGCSGDSEFWHRILAHGWTCRYEPSAVAFHFHRRDFAGLSNQIFHYMRGHSAALMVQYERSGNLGNLRRAFLDRPQWYAERVARRLWRGASDRDRFLLDEISGFVSGLLFYARQPRSGRG
jgi:glycosyltransferase involved in cell wall biosynthesis